MNYSEVHDFIIKKLETGLPEYLSYHNLEHTKYVLKSAEHIAREEGVTGDDLALLKTAALLHDIGFLQHHEQHEELSCKMAKKILPEYHYSEDQIRRICGMIMSTKIPQSAHDHLSQILCDADLFYLGTDKFKEYSGNLFHEFKKRGILKSELEWEIKQIDFFESHEYYTNTAKSECGELKRQHLEELKDHVARQLSIAEHNSKWKTFKDVLFTILGVLFAGIALKGFLIPNHFFDGGITGISLLIHEIYHIDIALLIIVFNLPFILYSYKSVGKRFALRMFVSVLLLGLCLSLLPNIALTGDKLLIAVFGGAFLGIGVGFTMRSGAALDGIEILAIHTLRRSSFTITEIILAINIVIFSVAAIKFGIDKALYSILTYYTATQCMNYVVEGIEAYTGVTIISGKSEAIKYEIVNKLGRGITVYKGERGFLPGKFDISQDCDIIFTVITRLELNRLNKLVKKTDPNAFVFANTIKEASGGILKRLHHH